MKLSKKLMIGVSLGLVGAAVAGYINGVNSKQVGIRGRIDGVQYDELGNLKKFLVKGMRQEDTMVDTAVVSVEGMVGVSEVPGQYPNVNSKLVEGANVEVYFDKILNQGAPIEVRAEKIVLIKE